MLLHFFTDNASVVNAMTLVVVAGLFYVLWRAARDKPTDLGVIAAFSILALLVAYHRLYDAGIIVLPIGWAIVNGRRGVSRWPARVILLLTCVYFVQQEWIDERFFGAAGRPALSDAWWFNLFVEPHHQWELLTMFGCIVAGLWRQRTMPDRVIDPVGREDVQRIGLPGPHDVALRSV